jgi:branched-chain amino acid transport system substrate-binding protein
MMLRVSGRVRTLSLRRTAASRVAGVVVALVLTACQPAASPPAPAAPAPAAAPAAPAAAGVAASPAASPAAAPAAAKPSGPAPATIKIGAVVPLTGRYGALGDQVKSGYELAVDDINKAGGVQVKELDRKIPLELKLLDDASDLTQNGQRIESLNSSEQVLVQLGGAGSDLHAAAASLAEKNKTPYLGIAFALNSIHQRGLKYLFSPFPKSPGIAKTTFDLMDSLSPKPTKVAIFAEKTDWGAELHELWAKEAKARGYEIVADEEYAPGAKDFAPMILKAKSTNAEAVLALPNPPDGMAIFKQMKELDFNPTFDFFIRAPDNLSWIQNLGKDGDQTILAPGWSPDLKFPGVEQLKAAHQARYNKPADALVGPAYALVQITANSIERAGRLDRDAVRDAIAATDLMTVEGPVKFNPDGTGQVLVVVNQYQNGKQVLIWPKEQASSAIMYPAKPWNQR